jgi:NADP-dependent 3-hydroxy acid dehydrogenase YdfG
MHPSFQNNTKRLEMELCSNRICFLNARPMTIFPREHVSLVTGASGGIGAAVATALAARGSKVAVHYRTKMTPLQIGSSSKSQKAVPGLWRF